MSKNTLIPHFAKNLIFLLFLWISTAKRTFAFSAQPALRPSVFSLGQVPLQKQRGGRVGAPHPMQSGWVKASSPAARTVDGALLASKRTVAEEVEKETQMLGIESISQPLVGRGRNSKLRFGWAMASGAVGATAVLLGISDVPLTFLLSIYVVLALGIQGGVLALSLGLMRLVSTYKKVQTQITGKK